MGCTPPFVNGSGGWCNCNCNCCPPPSCASVTVQFQCGTTTDNWDGDPNNNTGCSCTSTSFRLRNAPKTIAFPKFDLRPISSPDGNFVFALGGSCSVPCTSVTVTVTTTGCGFVVSGGSITHVGSGTVTASASPSSGSGSCSTLTPSVNGTENSATVADGGGVSITLDSSDGSCCPCCQIGNPSCGGSSMMKWKNTLRMKVKKTTSPRSKPTSEPQP